MFASPYATKYTREHQRGHKAPSIDPTNRKALQKPSRTILWKNAQTAAANA